MPLPPSQQLYPLRTCFGEQSADIALDRTDVAGAVTSERWFRLGDKPAGMGFAPLSRFWRSTDGWVRTHANYPWHREALLRTLDIDDNIDTIAAVIGTARAEDVEEAVFVAGGIAAAVRDLEAWRDHPSRAADGIRILDLTRVIAGPVCTRFLGALGAVLRIDSPDHLDMRPGIPAGTLLAKRSALLDLPSSHGSTVLHALLGTADAVVCGYRRGSLDRFGLPPKSLAGRHPGLVAVFIDAWGHAGPRSDRRGFDSVVQAPTSIAAAESVDGDCAPGSLPCQLLDHATGYLAAAAILDWIIRERAAGGSHLRRLSLARTAMWVTATTSTKPSSPGLFGASATRHPRRRTRGRSDSRTAA